MVSLGDDGVITMNRGDTAKFPLFINKGTSLQPSRYELGDKDQVFLALMEPNQPFEEALLKQYMKNLPEGYRQIDFNEERDDYHRRELKHFIDMIDVCQGAQAVCSKTVSLPNSCLIRTFDFVGIAPGKGNACFWHFVSVALCPLGGGGIYGNFEICVGIVARFPD